MAGERRIGIVGGGFIGRIHSWALYALTKGGVVDAAVTHVFDLDSAVATELARPHDAEVVADLGALLEAVDTVWICTPTAAHLAVAREAAARGRSIYCEKPLGRDLAEAAEVADVLAAVPHQVGLVLRASPVFRLLHDAVASGRYGRLMAIVFRDDQAFPVGGQYGSTWRSDVAQAGGGTLLEHSIHDLDLLRWIGGDPTTVSGRTASFAGHPGVEDVASVDLAYGSGAVATLTSVWHRILSRPSTRRIEVFCEDALLWADHDHLGPVHLQTSEGEEILDCPQPEWVERLAVPEAARAPLAMYAAPDFEFLVALDGERPGMPGADEAMAAHHLVDAAYRSAASGGEPVGITFVR
ncbi:MAG TPA: Gfo/Idh/MocA family oxidoreductase [Acidimicrobiia bacterium]|nr:Gfo/Idh/MocA family oxidoreductase [Acidimicrobiia bacterium]